MALIWWTTGKRKEKIKQRLSIQKHKYLRHITCKGGKKLLTHSLNNFNGGNWSKRTKYNQGLHKHNFKRWLKQSSKVTHSMRSHFLSLSISMSEFALPFCPACAGLVLSLAEQFSSANQQNTIHCWFNEQHCLRSSWAVGLTQGKLQEPAGTNYHFGSSKLFSWLNHFMKHYGSCFLHRSLQTGAWLKVVVPWTLMRGLCTAGSYIIHNMTESLPD